MLQLGKDHTFRWFGEHRRNSIKFREPNPVITTRSGQVNRFDPRYPIPFSRDCDEWVGKLEKPLSRLTGARNQQALTNVASGVDDNDGAPTCRDVSPAFQIPRWHGVEVLLKKRSSLGSRRMCP
mmetsp:Transcript_3503/g.16048  ORF Transcript_3503/g.16048 Transcript_3503/m.16048 type:complete len:124 (+) Transcript_3503:122-493(+)